MGRPDALHCTRYDHAELDDPGAILEEQKQQPPIIRTKLHRPLVPDEFVCRTRLHEALDRGLALPLTLVSAPAGYGKSTLVSHWAESLDRSCAWVSLDKTDSDLRSFLAYLLAALDTVSPGACPVAQQLLRSPEPPPTAVLAGHLVNELDAVETPLVIALDDYHRVDRASPVHQLVAGLLEHPARQVHLVLITRHDPPLPLASLRAGNRVNEVRLHDLRFSSPESDDLLARTVEQVLSEDALANLQREVEGWAAGLRLVSLALRRARDPDAFLRDLHGGLAHTQEYLLTEVLTAQSPRIRERLLDASILDRFCADLLDAICPLDEGTAEQPEITGRGFVDLLKRGNIFTIPLDVHGEWFRFHHLFRALLSRRLARQRTPAEVANLHMRASEWFEARALITESIEHALAAENPVGAAEIVERHRHAELEQDRWYVVCAWLDRLPAEIKQERPHLLMSDGWNAYCRLQLKRIPQIVEQCESAVGDQPLEKTVAGELGFFRGSAAYWSGDAESSRRHLEEALPLIGGTPLYVASEAELVLALARCMSGDEELAVRRLEERVRGAVTPSGVYVAKLCGALALVHLLSADLPRARAAAQRMRSAAIQSSARNHEAWSDYLEGTAHLHANELEAASLHFTRAVESRHVLETRAVADAFSGLALTQELMQQSHTARETAGRLQHFARELNQPECLAVADSCAARLSILRGDIAPAESWALSFSEAPSPDSLLMWLEPPSITRARVLIAVGSEECLKVAAEELHTLRQHTELWRYSCQTIEVAALQALALERRGLTDEAELALREAVALARPGGWVRPFREGGPVMAGLLRRLGEKAEEGDDIHRLLSAIEDRGAPPQVEESPAGTVESSAAPRAERSPHTGRPAIDALTNREQDILELLARRLQNKEIAASLSISTHTVNDHLKHIYQKLGISGRRRAVERAVETGILERE